MFSAFQWSLIYSCWKLAVDSSQTEPAGQPVLVSPVSVTVTVEGRQAGAWGSGVGEGVGTQPGLMNPHPG